jgi:hypothetical protein
MCEGWIGFVLVCLPRSHRGRWPVSSLTVLIVLCDSHWEQVEGMIRRVGRGRHFVMGKLGCGRCDGGIEAGFSAHRAPEWSTASRYDENHMCFKARRLRFSSLPNDLLTYRLASIRKTQLHWEMISSPNQFSFRRMLLHISHSDTICAG